MNRPDEPETQAPIRLIEDLRALDRRALFVPPAVDERVLAEVRRHLAERGHAATPWGALRPRLALAACLAALGLLAALFVVRSPQVAREDLNRDGAVDIRDAFALARSLETGAAHDRAWDFNRDGTVDRGDVDTLAAQAVRLPNAEPAKVKEAVGEMGNGNAALAKDHTVTPEDAS